MPLKCTYRLEGKRVFDNVDALNDFLLVKYNHINELGDSVFSDRNTEAYLNAMRKGSRWIDIVEKHKNGVRKRMLDKDDPDNPDYKYHVRYMGVTTAVGRMKDPIENSFIAPQFVRDNYFDNLYLQLKNGNVDEGSHWNPKDIELLFGDSANAVKIGRSLSKEDFMRDYASVIQAKWEHQAKYGNAVHDMLQGYFVGIGSYKDAKGKLTSSPIRLIGIKDKDQTVAKQKRWEAFKEMVRKSEFYTSAYFDDSGKKKLMGGQVVQGVPESLVSDEDMRTVFEIAEQRYNALRARNGLSQGQDENFTIFAEYAIADEEKVVTTTDYVTGKEEDVRLSGSIDLMVLHDDGTPDVIDWKTSPDDYMVNGKKAWSQAKMLTYNYQLGFYRQILGRNGFNTTRSGAFISPVITGKITMTRDADGSPVFSNEKIDLDTNLKYTFDDITPQVNSEVVQVHLNRIMEPGEPHTASVGNEHLVEKSAKDIALMFGNEDYSTETITDEQIKEEFDKYCEQNEKTGQWIYYNDKNHKWRVLVAGKPIIADTPEKMYELIKEYKTNKPMRRRQESIECANAIRNLLAGHIDESEFYSNRNYGERLYSMIGQYTDAGWTMVENQQQLNEMGLIAFYNTLSGQVDVICLTNEDPFKRVPMKKGQLLSANFYDDMIEKTKNSPMLEALVGNVEIMKAMLILNNTKLFENGNNFIGNIRVFDTSTRRQLHALNSKVKYSFNTLTRYIKDESGNRAIKVNHDMKIGTDKMMIESLLRQVQKRLDDDLEMGRRAEAKGIRYEHNDLFRNKTRQRIVYFGRDHTPENLSSFLFQANITKLELERGYMRILETLEQNYGDQFRKVGEDEFSITGRNSEIRALYITVSRALAELNGIQLNQQTFQSDKYSQYGIAGALTKGWTGLQMSNPGMFASDVINDVTNLLRRSYQDIRDRMQSPLAVFKQLEDRMIKANNVFGGSLLAAKEHIWDEFFVTDKDGNISDAMMFKHPEEISDPVKREILHDLLTEINRYRFSREMSGMDAERRGQARTDMLTDEQVWDYAALDRFYYIPLARKGWVDERGSVTNNGMTWTERFNSIKEGLFNLKNVKNTLLGIFDNSEESVKQSKELRQDTSLFKMNEVLVADAMDMDERIRKIQQMKNEDNANFTNNAVLAGATMAFNQVSTEEIDKVLLLAKASVMHLRSEETEMGGMSYKNDIDYLLKYIKGVIKSEDLTEESMKGVADFFANVSRGASFAVLGISPVQVTYQTMQGIMQNLSASAKKYLGDASFGIKEVEQAAAIVYGDIASDSNSKVALLNQALGVNDMDMNDYVKHAQDRKNLRTTEGLYKLGMMTSSRPDYYNRMILIVAQMIKDGVWDAYYVEDGVLKYDFKKDKRFSKLTDPNTPHDAEWYRQKGLYDAIARQMLQEGTRYTSNTKVTVGGQAMVKKANSFFEYNGTDIVPLPKAYPSRQTDGYKNIADDIYGYYTHENKAMIHLSILGKMYMQFKTFFSGKANQYLAPGKVRMRGTFEQMKDQDGNLIYQGSFSDESLIVRKQKPDGSYGFFYLDTDEEIPNAKEENYIPFYQWKGIYQEGVFMTFANIVRLAKDSDRDGILAFIDAVKKYSTDEFTRDVFRTNFRQMLSDLIIMLLIGGLAAFLMNGWYKDMLKDDDIPGPAKSMAGIALKSLKNSTADANTFGVFWSVFGNWTPFTFNWMTNTYKNMVAVMGGKRDVWDAACYQISGLSQVKETVEDIVA